MIPAKALEAEVAAELAYMGRAPSKENQRLKADFRLRLLRQVFISCWTYGEHESEAMWRLYSPGAAGVAIQTSYAKLAETLREVPWSYIGLVKYIDYESEVLSGVGGFDQVMHKRVSFRHEQEVRLVLRSDQPIDDDPPGFLKVRWNPEAFVDKVYVDPYAAPWFYDVVKDVLGRYSSLLQSRLCWSQMRWLGDGT